MRTRNRVAAMVAAVALMIPLGGLASADELDPAAPSADAAVEQVIASVEEEVTDEPVEASEPAPAPTPEVKTDPVVTDPVESKPAAPEPAPAPVVEAELVETDAPKTEPAPADPVESTDITETPDSSATVADTSPEPAPAPNPEGNVVADPISETVLVEECSDVRFAEYTSHPETGITTGGVFGWAEENPASCDREAYVILIVDGEHVRNIPFTFTSARTPIQFDYLPPRDGQPHQYRVLVFIDVSSDGPADYTIPWYAAANPSVTFDYEAEVANITVEGDMYIIDSNGVKYTRSSQVPVTDGTTFTAYPSIDGEVFRPGTVTTWTYNDSTPVEPTIIEPVDKPEQIDNLVTLVPKPGQFYTVGGEPLDEPIEGPVSVLPVHTDEKPLLICTNLVDPVGTQFPEGAKTCWSYVYVPAPVVDPPVHPPVTPPVEPIVPDPVVEPPVAPILELPKVVVIVVEKPLDHSKHKTDSAHKAKPVANPSHGSGYTSNKELASTGVEDVLPLAATGLLVSGILLLVFGTRRRRATQR